MDLKDGFWVGDSPTDSYFVDLADSLTTTPTGLVLPLTQGQPVSLTGQLVANTPDYIAEATSDGIPNISQIVAEGYHIATAPEQVHEGRRHREGPARRTAQRDVAVFHPGPGVAAPWRVGPVTN